MEHKMKQLFGVVFILAGLMACKHEAKFEDVLASGDTDGKQKDNTENTNEKPCDPDSSYFVNDVFPILKSNCAFSGCHGDGSAKGKVNLTNYNSVINTADVTAFNIEESDLYDMITETDPDKRMPPPPENRLTNDQIAIIRKWIQQGAQNNSCDGCDSSNVTFSSTIFPIIQNNCMGCHSGSSPSGNLRLTNYEQIQAQAFTGALFGAVSHNANYVAMPYKQEQLSDCRIAQIRIWITQGALNN